MFPHFFIFYQYLVLHNLSLCGIIDKNAFNAFDISKNFLEIDLKSEDYYMKRFIGCYNKSVILTYMSVVAAVFGIWHVSQLKDLSGLPLIMACLIIAGICDMFDGKVARDVNEMIPKKNLVFN